MKIFVKTLAMLFFCFLSTQSFGQDIKQDPIDIRLKNCLNTDANQTTYGMMQCEASARDEWDKELNKYYKLLMGTLTDEQKEKLKHAQRQWLAFRDKELEFSGQMYYDMDGTMYRVMAAGRETELVRQRALELKEYYLVLIGE